MVVNQLYGVKIRKIINLKINYTNMFKILITCVTLSSVVKSLPKHENKMMCNKSTNKNHKVIPNAQ